MLICKWLINVVQVTTITERTLKNEQKIVCIFNKIFYKTLFFY